MIANGWRMLSEIGPVQGMISSANGTYLDRIELALLRSCDAPVSAMAGHMAETFSVNPLAGVAATILTGRLPRLVTDAPLRQPLKAATGDEKAATFAALATDYNGVLAAAQVTVLR